MYTKYLGLQGKPFHAALGSRLLYANAAYQEAYIKLLDWVYERKGLAVLSGDAGTGKTTLLRNLLSNFQAEPTVRCLFFSYTGLTFAALLNFVCEDLELEVKKEGTGLRLQALTDFLQARSHQGETIALLLDEAHSLSVEVLKQIPLLVSSHPADPPLLQIILSGRHPEFRDKLQHPDLAQLRQRIGLHCQLGRLTNEEVPAFIHHRLRAGGSEKRHPFSPEALRLITSYTKGVPRTINAICDSALQVADASAQKRISAKIVLEAARTLQFQEETGAARPEPETIESEPEGWKRAMLPGIVLEPAQPRSWSLVWIWEKITGKVSQGRGIPLLHFFVLQKMWMRGTASVLVLLCLAALTFHIIGQGAPQIQERAESLVTFSPQPHEQSLDSPEKPSLMRATHAVPELASSAHAVTSPQTAKRGQVLFDMLVRKYPKIQPFVWGLMTPYPAVALFLPEAEWAALSKEDQVSLTLYVKEWIPKVKAHPARHLAAFRTEPGYASLRTKVANLCTDCWVIGAGRLTLDQQGVLLDRVVVQGDTLWEKSESHDRGMKASEFQPGYAVVASGVPEGPANAIRWRTAGQQFAYVPYSTESLARAEGPARTRHAKTAVDNGPQRASLNEPESMTTPAKTDALSARHTTEEQPQRRAAPVHRGGKEEKTQAEVKKGRTRSVQTVTLNSVPRRVSKQRPRKENHTQLGQRDVSHGGRALLENAEKGNLSTVKLLLETGVSPNERLSGGWTALMMATIHGHIAIVKMLLDHGADVHAQNNRGMTALMYAAWNKHAAIVQTLLAHGARLDTKDQDGWTALQYAKDTRLQSSTQTGSAAIVALLQKAKVRRQLLHLAPPESQQIGSIDLRDLHSGRIY